MGIRNLNCLAKTHRVDSTLVNGTAKRKQL